MSLPSPTISSTTTTTARCHTAPLRIPATSPFLRPTTGGADHLKHPSSTSRLHFRINVASRPHTEVYENAEYLDVIQNSFPAVKKWQDIVEDDTDNKARSSNKVGQVVDKVRSLVGSIRSMLQSMEDGEISLSAYDTAWVALVEDIDGSGKPQFPSSLQWISRNQLRDGSWGDREIFSAHDRILNTLACVIALRSWNMHPDKSDKGIAFLRENIKKLEDENDEHMPIGFEVALPSLIDIAKKLYIEIPHDSPALQQIYAKRDLKLTRIPRDMMHKVPTTLLHSLEGMHGLDWEKLLHLQSSDGSFLFSPSSTAFALQQTKDHNCLQYLANQVQKFNGGVPNVYPVDMFEHMWAVDRLQRLGISRFFEDEIKECVDYVSRYWTKKGISWARNSQVQDIDDTAMGFRLLRLHGYDVSADVFKHFQKGGEFFCFAGQTTQAVTGMYNLYRASQLKFPGETVLEDAAKFSGNYLHEKRANEDVFDKWIITKDLHGEVAYALDIPWYANLPRVESRIYIDQYGGKDDVWIGKTLYRMANVNSNTYLELAKLDYNSCQTLHQREWRSIQKWYKSCNLGEFGLSERRLLLNYYIAAASEFEPEKSDARMAWAKTTILLETIVSHFEKQQLSKEQRNAFVKQFENEHVLKFPNGGRTSETRNGLVGIVVRTLNQLALDTLLAHGRDTHHHLHHAWHNWLRIWEEQGKTRNGDAELLLRTLNLCGSNSPFVSEDLLVSNPKYQELLGITNRVCHQLQTFQRHKEEENNGWVHGVESIRSVQIESDMQELVKLVLTKSSSSGELDSHTKQNFLTIARSFYYAAHCNTGTINSHIVKVLFEQIH